LEELQYPSVPLRWKCPPFFEILVIEAERAGGPDYPRPEEKGLARGRTSLSHSQLLVR